MFDSLCQMADGTPNGLQRFEIITSIGRRHRFSQNTKRPLRQSRAPGASISEVARQGLPNISERHAAAPRQEGDRWPSACGPPNLVGRLRAGTHPGVANPCARTISGGQAPISSAEKTPP